MRALQKKHGVSQSNTHFIADRFLRNSQESLSQTQELRRSAADALPRPMDNAAQVNYPQNVPVSSKHKSLYEMR